MRVLLVDDNPITANAITSQLAAAGIACDGWASREPSLSHLAESAACDLMIFSLPFEGSDAVSLIRELRRGGVRAPVMVLQDMQNSDEAVALFDAGADDVVVKPIKPHHLAARIRAIVRRQNGYGESRAQVGELTYWFDGRQPELSGHTLALSKRERALLECLVLRAGRIVSREFIFTNLYGSYAGDVDPKIIDVYICKLRKKLREASGKDYIKTVFGMGYLIADPAEDGVSGRAEGAALAVAAAG